MRLLGWLLALASLGLAYLNATHDNLFVAVFCACSALVLLSTLLRTPRNRAAR